MGRILLVEDQQSAQLLFRNRLEEMAHAVHVVPTGAMGLIEARGGGYDLYLVNVELGSGIDGYEVCRRIKSIPQVQRIPVVLFSSHACGNEELHRGYQAGCAAFLHKGELALLEDVVSAMLNLKAQQDDLALQNRVLEDQNRRLSAERQRSAELEAALRDSGSRATVFRELAAGRPDGVLLVDAEGIVRFADRGAVDLLGNELEGRNLGSLAPSSGLEAFVRDARNEPREGFRFDIATRGGKVPRSLSASVIPIAPLSAGGPAGLRVVLILDAFRRRLAAEVLRLQEQGIPRREIGPLIEAGHRAFQPNQLIGTSSAMTELRRTVTRAARLGQNALVRGEPGTGKGLVAYILHFSSRRSGPLVPVNCAALSPDSIAAELFGHVKGAFAGALFERPGLLHQSHQGTLFLHEIDAIPAQEQALLARALADAEVLRLGATRPEHVDLRVVATTSADLRPLVADGSFDADLFQRIADVEILLPPLRERREDIPALVEHYAAAFATERESLAFAPEAIDVLQAHVWPGNVRELLECIERVVALTPGEWIDVEHLPQALRDSEAAQDRPRDVSLAVAERPERPVRGTHSVVPPSGSQVEAEGEQRDDQVLFPPPGSLMDYEKLCLLNALKASGGDKTKAAQILRVAKSTLYRKLRDHGLR